MGYVPFFSLPKYFFPLLQTPKVALNLDASDFIGTTSTSHCQLRPYAPSTVIAMEEGTGYDLLTADFTDLRSLRNT